MFIKFLILFWFCNNFVEVMPMSSTTKIIKKEPFVQTVKAPPGLLLNTKKPIATTSMDVKPIISADNDSLDGLDRKTTPRTYSGNSDRKSKSPEPNHSNLMYSNLKLPSPEPMEGMANMCSIRVAATLIALFFAGTLKWLILKIDFNVDIHISISSRPGIRRKHCNCTKSQCLKLYCDCFANGEFCSNCNCKECFNTLEKEDERQKAIKICLERNPHAFK